MVFKAFFQKKICKQMGRNFKRSFYHVKIVRVSDFCNPNIPSFRVVFTSINNYALIFQLETTAESNQFNMICDDRFKLISGKRCVMPNISLSIASPLLLSSSRSSILTLIDAPVLAKVYDLKL